MNQNQLLVDSAREFQINELFFSTTDCRGIITSGNSVFSRVSAYPMEELLGAPHNVIRHPDMPRCVFKLLWDYLKAGKPIAAYVKNLARDGRYYWVVALATPIENGYLSVRFKPSAPLWGTVETAYRELRSIEQSHDEEGSPPSVGTAASTLRLQELLSTLGLPDYDLFMRTMLHQELNSRDGQLEQKNLTMFPALPEQGAREGAQTTVLRRVYSEALETYREINSLFSQLGNLNRLNEQISAHAQTILRLASEFRYVPLNVAIKSSCLNAEGLALGVIASHLDEAATGLVGIVSALASHAGTVSSRLQETVFDLAAARLQFEMMSVYYREILGSLGDSAAGAEDAAQAVRRQNLDGLRSAVRHSTERAVTSLNGLETDLVILSSHAEDLRKAMLSLQVAHIAGLVESSRVREDLGFRVLFDEIRKHIDGAKRELDDFNHAIRRLGNFARQTPVVMRAIRQGLA